MARTALTVVNAYGTKDPAVIDETPDAGDSVNGHVWSIQENDVVVVYNAGTSAIQATLKGAADIQGRSADSAKSIAAGDIGFFGPLKREAWEQSGGEGWLDVDTDTDPQVLVLRLASALT